jgi:hypothetical protein
MNFSQIPHEPLAALIAGILILVMPGFPNSIVVIWASSGDFTISGSC